jgi:PhnB protein
MKRSMMQIYAKNSHEAWDFYKKVFPDAIETGCWGNEDGSIGHAEMTLFGQVIAMAQWEKASQGNAMQFCFHFDEAEKHVIDHAYELLKDDAEILHPLGPCDYSPHMMALTDKYGVNWCLFI